jgi:hypothetical protein
LKAFQIFILAGGFLMIVGVYLLIPADPLTASHIGALQAGANQYLYDKFNVLKTGHMGGQYSESEGEALQVFVFTDSQYAAFASGSTPEGLFASDGSSGTISVSMSSPGNYYLVFVHGSGFENSVQNLSFSVTLDGYNPVILAAGLGSLAAGAVSLVIGYRLRNKYLDSLIASKPRDVVSFDQPPPPASPPPSSPPA